MRYSTVVDKKSSRVVVTLLSTGLVLAGIYSFFLGRQVGSSPVPESIQPVAREGSLPEIASLQESDSEQMVDASSPPSAHQMSAPVAGCDGKVPRPLREIPAGGIVKWIDEQGITHYEDYHGVTAPEGKKLVTRFPDTKEYFSLRIEAASGRLPTSFREKISNKAIWIYEHYRTLLDERYLSRADVHLVVHNSRKSYEVVRNRYVGEKSEDVSGFYIVSGNRAELLHEGNEEQTLQVMVHEVVHVINNQLFGPLPRWLNEGLATYMDALNRDEKHPSTAKDRLRLIKKQVGLPLLERVNVRQLLDSKRHAWSPQQRETYYPFSQLLVTYLLEPQNRTFFQAFLSTIAANKCETMDEAAYIEANYKGGIDKLDADYRQWLN